MARLRERERAAARAALDALRARSALCDEVEALAAAGAVPAQTLDGLRARWDALPPAGDGADAVTARFERALAAGEDDAARAALAAEHDANREAREALCLRMEIVAGVDSPPAFAQARMQAQVARLASAFGDRKSAGRSAGGAAGEGPGADDGESLLRRWCCAGPASPADAPGLQARFGAALEAWGRR